MDIITLGSVVVVLLWLAICLFIGYWLRFRVFSRTSRTQSDFKAVNEEKRCPHCGHMQHFFYTPATDPVPVLYQCYECKRYFGDASRMTPEQKKLLLASDAECARVDNMPELWNILSTVASYYTTYFNGFNTGRDTIISIRNGVVRAGKYNVIASYDTPTTEIGDQHICFLCLQYLKRRFPAKNFILGEWFVDIES